jgi:hypothetical protein
MHDDGQCTSTAAVQSSPCLAWRMWHEPAPHLVALAELALAIEQGLLLAAAAGADTLHGHVCLNWVGPAMLWILDAHGRPAPQAALQRGPRSRRCGGCCLAQPTSAGSFAYLATQRRSPLVLP